MPKVKIDYVVSFSSEANEYPASNLLAIEISKKRWVGANKGESSNSVVLQLVKSVKISSLHIGSYDSAFIEVLVGRSERPNESFKVLIPSSIFMTPIESKKGEGTTKLRTFNYEQLSEETRNQKWDRVRVVCRQPYNKHIRFGLVFIHIFETENIHSLNSSPEKPSLVKKDFQQFEINAQSSDEDDTFKPGELFAKMKNITNNVSTESQIRKASTPEETKNILSLSQTIIKTPITKEKSKTSTKCHSHKKPDEKLDRHRDSLLYTNDDEKLNEKVDKVIQRDKEEKERKRIEHKKQELRELYAKDILKKESSKDEESPRSKQKDVNKIDSIKHNCNSESNSKTAIDTSQIVQTKKDSHKNEERNKTDRRQSKKREHSHDKSSQAKRLKIGKKTDSPQTLMCDVVFVISGYVNPRRAKIRDTALAMGAKYRQDWCRGCTHLICAFPNTPKLNQVRSSKDSAVVVTAEWIEECCKEQRRLPWQWYATEPEKKVARSEAGSESDEEINRKVEEECDTDDEIEKVLQKQRKAKNVLNDIQKISPSEVKKNEFETNESKKEKITVPLEQEKKSPKKTRSPKKNESLMNSSSDSVTFVKDERVKAEIAISDSETSTDDDKVDMPLQVKIDEEKCLPPFFDESLFVIDKENCKDYDVNLIRRYIIAYGGDVVDKIRDGLCVSYIITTDARSDVIKKVTFSEAVTPEWIWECNDRRKIVSTKEYAVT